MSYSSKKLSRLIVAACVQNHIKHVVISPGSRNAPLTIGFSQEKKIQCYSIVDERCAAFFAIGMAQQLREPIVLVCTSGSALLNYYPAIAEAFYSHYPILVISADRPKHLIDIGDGQTIRQPNVFANHILYSSDLTDNSIDFEVNKSEVLKTLQIAITKCGPVHINVPFDEPLYTLTEKPLLERLSLLPIKDKVSAKNISFKEPKSIFYKAKKILILIGTQYPDKKLEQLLSNLLEKDSRVLIFTETTSNIHHPGIVNSIDKLINSLSEDEFRFLQPDLLITLGGMVISKKVKKFLRTYPLKNHWHISRFAKLDTYHCLSNYFPISPVIFFEKLLELNTLNKGNYQKIWTNLLEEKRKLHAKFLENAPFSDLKVFDILLKNLPKHCQLQLSNSSVIRYVQLFDNDPDIAVFCNRGTSGIDGSISTATGAAVTNAGQTVLITGDLSFFYDSNALWNAYLPESFRIIVINNQGGGIFKILPGPSDTDALPYFTTPHQLNASHLCRMYNIEYHKASGKEELLSLMSGFFRAGNTPKLLEIFTPSDKNDEVLKAYFKALE